MPELFWNDVTKSYIYELNKNYQQLNVNQVTFKQNATWVII